MCSSPKSDFVFFWCSNLVICITEMNQSFINTGEQRAVYNRIKPVLQAHGSCITNVAWINIYVNGRAMNEWSMCVRSSPMMHQPVADLQDQEGPRVETMWAESLSELCGQGGTKWLFHFRFGIKRKRKREEMCLAWESARKFKLDFMTGS